MALITNSLTLLGVDIYWQTFVTGADTADGSFD